MLQLVDFHYLEHTVYCVHTCRSRSDIQQLVKGYSKWVLEFTIYGRYRNELLEDLQV